MTGFGTFDFLSPLSRHDKDDDEHQQNPVREYSVLCWNAKVSFKERHMRILLDQSRSRLFFGFCDFKVLKVGNSLVRSEKIIDFVAGFFGNGIWRILSTAKKVMLEADCNRGDRSEVAEISSACAVLQVFEESDEILRISRLHR